MGCSSSGGGSVGAHGVRAEGQREKCLRETCSYLKHSSQGHGFCCHACRTHGTHGPACQKVLAEGGRGPALEKVPAAGARNETTGAVAPEASPGAFWQASLRFGRHAIGMDESNGVTATETMHLVAHQGKLFASFGKWMSPEFVAKDFSKMQNFVGRLDSAGGKWVVDMQGQHESKHAARLSCLSSITWPRDCHGKELEPSVQALVVTFGLGKHGNFMMFRDDKDDSAPGTQHSWHQVKYAEQASDFTGGDTARAVLVHRDGVTGVDRIFALQGTCGAVSGVYDPSSKNPGKVVWDSCPEKLDLASIGKAKRLPFRPLSMVAANGKLYLSSAGLILQRVDGASPVWRVVVNMATLRPGDGKLNEAVGGIRGMTVVPNPVGSGSSVLFCWNPNERSKSRIHRADPSQDGSSLNAPVEEASINALAKRYLGHEDLYYTLAAYNDMLETTVGTAQCNLIGFEVVVAGRAVDQLPLDPGQKVQEKSGKLLRGYWAGGGFAVRKGPDEYEVMEVGGPRNSASHVDPALTAVRCYANSPFPEEPGFVYFAGYDCNSFPSQDTAWIYKGRLAN